MAFGPQLQPIDVVCVERSERQLSALREYTCLVASGHGSKATDVFGHGAAQLSAF